MQLWWHIFVWLKRPSFLIISEELRLLSKIKFFPLACHLSTDLDFLKQNIICDSLFKTYQKVWLFLFKKLFYISWEWQSSKQVLLRKRCNVTQSYPWFIFPVKQRIWIINWIFEKGSYGYEFKIWIEIRNEIHHNLLSQPLTKKLKKLFFHNFENTRPNRPLGNLSSCKGSIIPTIMY